MSFSSLAFNQCVSYNNLQSGVDQGYFDAKTTIPATNQESTKTAAYTYVNVDPNYPPFAVKLDNQLVVKGDLKDNVATIDIYNGFFTGTITDVQVNGVSITGAAFPIDVGNVRQGYTDQLGTYDITLYYADADMPSNYARCYDSDFNTVCIDGFTSLGPGPYYVTFPSQVVNTFRAVYIETGDGNCTGPTPPPVDFTGPIVSVAVSKDTGQYMVAVTGSKFVVNCGGSSTLGSLNVSSNYGASWTRIPIDNYWSKVAVSGDGHYMLAVSLGGYAYQSTNYGSTWSYISVPVAAYSGCAISGNGQYQTIVGYYSGNGSTYYIYRSLDYGSTWTSTSSRFSISPSSYGTPENKNFSGCAMSSDGVYQTIITGIDALSDKIGLIFYSLDGTSNPATFDPTRNPFGSLSATYLNQWFTDITCSPNGGKLFATMSNTPTPGIGPYKLYKSTNYGVDWSVVNDNDYWIGVTANDTSISLGVVCGNTYIKVINAASVISDLTGSGVRSWKCIDVNNGGAYILAGTTSGLFLSTDYGTTFTSV
jgi:hypothetical protein